MRTILIGLLFGSAFANAGFFEIGLSGSYRESFIKQGYNSKTSSLTGSFSYYYMERSAVQFSFTQAVRRETTQLTLSTGGLPTNQLSITEMNIAGLDLVFSFADRKARVQPLIKAGVANMEKKFTTQLENQEADTPVVISGLSVSAGLGIKVKLTDTLAVNLTLDGWSSPIGGDEKFFDTRILGGISWFF